MLKIICNSSNSSGLLNRRIFLLFIISFAFISLSLSNVPAVEGQDSPKAASELLSKAQTMGNVRVIVKLNTSFRPEGTLSGTQAVISQQTRIANLQNQLHDALSKYNVNGIKKFRYIPYTAMEVDSTALAALLANPLVASIEEDIPVPPTLIQSVPLIKADQAWAAGYTGSGWTVAILDTGVDKTHSFFSGGKVVAEACYSTTNGSYPSTTVCPGGGSAETGSGTGVNCGGTYGTAIYGCDHGTHVAGIAAGKAATINGVAKDASIIAVQVFSSFSAAYCGMSTPCARSFPTDQILGLEYVYSLRSTYNIASINMSLGGSKYTSSATCDSDNSAIKAAIDNLRAAGIATVIASGNDGYTDGISAPGCVSTAVSVGATTKSDVEASYSNYHPTMLALFAPGSSITSSVPGGGWGSKSGTSMATPHVTGTWAILKQKSPAASVATLLSNLQTTGATITKKSGDLAGGTVKRIDVLAAISPYPPSGLSGSASSVSDIALSWTDNSSDEEGFKIERKTGVGGTYSEIYTTSAGETTYPDSGLSEGTTYYYRVRAYNTVGNSAYSNEANATTWPVAPSSLSATAISASEINLSWTNNSGGATGFKIQRKTGAGGTWGQIGTTAGVTYPDSGLTAETTYFYRVRAYNAGGDSDNSDEANATTPVAPPPSSGGGGGGGGCFIATAAFGSPLEIHVQILRDFRDRILLNSAPGKAFVDFYYRTSPAIADKIAQSEGLRLITRMLLMPVIGVAYLSMQLGIFVTLLLFAFTLSIVIFTIVLLRKKMRSSARAKATA